ncbi:efflux RND transporter periplasmic adaptor subunit [Agrobacterium tumefaciens]|uniref:efflux RND transporter periplasmic adaptor subunit n=1 Tax=Agrobacterium tumefaciens TaxID=358 RepID=UPI0012B8DF8E|nr:efflux RND transporter periplasmic adaptor subunit [Agrobacterium tumefaciens]MQB07330.1 efflux RND transporter periplasmic adaptor subunit [Agrobacterium tumefaciens]
MREFQHSDIKPSFLLGADLSRDPAEGFAAPCWQERCGGASRLHLSARSIALAGILALAGSQGAAAETIPPVSIATMNAEDIPIVNELPGRIAPTTIAEVRPRISGILVERVFEQGSLVKEGDVLYRIDPSPFRIQLESAQAALQRAKTSQTSARQRADRQAKLRESDVASSQQLEDARAQLAQANADVAMAAANLAQVQLNLDYSEVRAPISGRIGRALVTEGALVNSSNVLALIHVIDPVYADFTQSSTDIRDLRRALASGRLVSRAPGEADVRLRLDDGSDYHHRGILLFSDSMVDSSTGQIALRATFPNPEADLLPGMYVRIVIEQGVERGVVAAPRQAIQRDASGKAYVFIVNGEQKIEQRFVTINRQVEDRAVVAGLNPGDRAVVEGFQKIRLGSRVAPTEWAGLSVLTGMRASDIGLK